MSLHGTTVGSEREMLGNNRVSVLPTIRGLMTRRTFQGTYSQTNLSNCSSLNDLDGYG
jgi:hypothetical protein